MVEMSPLLNEALEVHANSIFYRELGSVIMVMSSKASSKHGANLHMVAYDEIHAANSRELYDVLTIGSGRCTPPAARTHLLDGRREPREHRVRAVGNGEEPCERRDREPRAPGRDVRGRP
jgi:hypothetical protein